MYQWSLRNNINNLKRSDEYACPINECDIEWIGEGEHRDKHGNVLVNDNDNPFMEGWYFVKATHKETGKVYYGYRLVSDNGDGTCDHWRYGVKIKPEHAFEIMDADDYWKGVSFRRNKRARIN